jgi:hypothetical protein
MTYVGSNVITTQTCPASKRQLERIYTVDEISVAVETARVYIPGPVGSIYRDPLEFENAWGVLHVITSDCTWRGGEACLVDSYLKNSVSIFVRYLIASTPALVMQRMSAVNFMVREFDNMDDPGFLRLLRAYLLAFPSIVDIPADDMPQRFIDPENEDVYNAVQLAASNPRVPPYVLSVLLEFGANANCTTSSGQSPMMGAILEVSDESICKLRRLLQYGGNIDLYDQSFQTVLHFGAIAGNVRGVRMILEARKQRLKDAARIADEMRNYMYSDDSDDISQTSGEEEYQHETIPVVDISSSSTATRRMYEYRLGIDIDFMRDKLDLQYPGALEGYTMRLRPQCELYVDPLHLPDCGNETPLTIAAGQCTMDFNERKTMISMLLDAGADADSDMHVPPGGLSSSPLCFGFVTCHERQGDGEGTFFMMIQIFKGMYRTSLYMDLDFTNTFLDIHESIFPACGISPFNVEEIFRSCKGQRFDFFYQLDLFDRPHDGIDFSLWFRITKQTTDEDGNDSIETVIILESEHDTDRDDVGKLTMRFPRGPCPVTFWTEDDTVGATFDSEITMHKHFTLLQRAAMCKYRETRRNMIAVARPLCNPLLKCDSPYNMKGSTAADILSTTILLDSHTGRFNATQNMRLLKTIQNDRVNMLHYIHKNAAVQQYTDVNAAFHMLNSTESDMTTQRPPTRPKFISPFHRLPDDVCQNILNFV